MAGSAWQIVNTLGPYVALWGIMYFPPQVSYWLVVPLAMLAEGGSGADFHYLPRWYAWLVFPLQASERHPGI